MLSKDFISQLVSICSELEKVDLPSDTVAYEKRLRLLRYTLYLSLFGGIALCLSLLFLLTKLAFISALFFGLYLILVLIALITLVYELAVSFEALTEHLEIMRSWKDKF